MDSKFAECINTNCSHFADPLISERIYKYWDAIGYSYSSNYEGKKQDVQKSRK